MGEWAALDAAADRHRLALAVGLAHDRMATGRRWPLDQHADGAVRPVIARSWARSLDAGLDPTTIGTDPAGAARHLSDDELAQRRAHHPLAGADQVLRRVIDDAGDRDHIGSVADADGAVLWIQGGTAAVDWAERFAPMVGLRCAEELSGTNALGTAIVERHGLQVFGGEHFGPVGHDWCCSAAPVFDPLSGELLGVIGLNAPLEAAHPHSLVLVTMAAREVERQVLTGAQRYATGLLHPPLATLAVLGRERGVLRIAGTGFVELSRRHTELLMLLIACPEGLTAEQLAIEAYGDHGRPGSVRTEMHRLRAQLGALLAERPYRLSGKVVTDFAAVEEHVREGRLAEALDRYPGPAVPRSEAPRLVELRDRLDDELRAAILGSGDRALLTRWLETPSGQLDVEARRRLGADIHRRTE